MDEFKEDIKTIFIPFIEGMILVEQKHNEKLSSKRDIMPDIIDPMISRSDRELAILKLRLSQYQDYIKN